MEKMTWSRPMASVEQFMPNEYIAACGDSGTVYKFTCDAGYVDKSHESGWCGCGEYHYRSVPDGTYTEKASWHVYHNGTDLTSWSTYSPCGHTHEAASDGVFLTGCYMDNPYTEVDENIPVTVWRGEDGKNVHCTTLLDINSWATVKS